MRHNLLFPKQVIAYKAARRNATGEKCGLDRLYPFVFSGTNCRGYALPRGAFLQDRRFYEAPYLERSSGDPPSTLRQPSVNATTRNPTLNTFCHAG